MAQEHSLWKSLFPRRFLRCALNYTHITSCFPSLWLCFLFCLKPSDLPMLKTSLGIPWREKEFLSTVKDEDEMEEIES
uniref:Uncharacterized protein n=1 Tax=Glossina palpalis gambiensis TaxID=67801 RepID=A0A1B0BIY9_9MUSC